MQVTSDKKGYIRKSLFSVAMEAQLAFCMAHMIVGPNQFNIKRHHTFLEERSFNSHLVTLQAISCEDCRLWGALILINEIEQEVTAKVAFLLVS